MGRLLQMADLGLFQTHMHYAGYAWHPSSDDTLRTYMYTAAAVDPHMQCAVCEGQSAAMLRHAVTHAI
jgi:hypothetical protein